MEKEELKKAIKEIRELGDDELGVLFTIVHKEIIRREAKKMILRAIDEQK